MLTKITVILLGIAVIGLAIGIVKLARRVADLEEQRNSASTP